VNAQTANATQPGGPGPVINIPAFSFAVYEPGNVPAGTYNVGIACTKGSASPTQLDKYWNVNLVVAASATDQRAGFTWTAQQITTTTTASTNTTTTGPATVAGTSATAAPTGGAPASPTVASSVAELPRTGASTTSLVVWSLLLLVFGRMAVLLGRTPAVRPRSPA